MIENPIYGGTYAYGKTAVVAGYDGAGVKVKIRRKACFSLPKLGRRLYRGPAAPCRRTTDGRP